MCREDGSDPSGCLTSSIKRVGAFANADRNVVLYDPKAAFSIWPIRAQTSESIQILIGAAHAGVGLSRHSPFSHERTPAPEVSP